MNQRKLTETSLKPLYRSFVRAGQKLPLQTTNKPKEGLLTKANDWVLLVDFEHKKIVFPPHIYPTNQRPDIIFWSRMSRSVILLELTCCAEEGVKAAQLRKQVRYHELVENVNGKLS